MYDQFNQHLSENDATLTKQNNALKQWKDFEADLDQINQWFKKVEVKFRDQPLQNSLVEKENQLKFYQAEREEVSQKEKEIDVFVDKSHALLHSSGSQRIKPLISQISSRYQILHNITKDVINRWQNIVDDHIKYKQRLDETSSWLEPLEQHLNVLKTGDLANNLEATTNRLQVLLSEREQGEHKVNSLTILGERLLADTATQGREIIRNELRSIRERWDALMDGMLKIYGFYIKFTIFCTIGIKNQQKLQDAQSLQLSSYQEMLQQTLTWLDSMEKLIKIDPSSWLSIQDVRSKLLKHKTTYQEILSHKRIIEGCFFLFILTNLFYIKFV